MTNNVGYLYCTEKGQVGEPGLFYDYLVAANGLFIRAQNPLLKATVCIADAHVRGLYPMRTMVELAHGKIPWHLYNLTIAAFMADASKEQYMAVVWEDGYHLKFPPQEATGASVKYEKAPNTVLEFHSHAHMSSFFSGTDNGDEQGLGIYVVVGRLNLLIPEVNIRVGVYGYFDSMNPSEVFGV